MGDKVIFENDRVRIWELVIPPGGDSNCHVHDLDYVLVQLGGDRVAAVPEPDTKSPYNQYMEADVVPGQVIYIERGASRSPATSAKSPTPRSSSNSKTDLPLGSGSFL
jgi:hypothetical protein